MRLLKLFLLMSALPLLAVECQEEPFEPEMPEPTQEGQDMVAAKINGAVWELKGDFRMDENPRVGFSLQEHSFAFTARRRDYPNVSQITLRHNQIYEEGQYAIWGSSGNRKTMLFSGEKRCIATQENPGILHIDYINENDQIIAGRFEFDGVCEDGDTIKVRDGWFDLNY